MKTTKQHSFGKGRSKHLGWSLQGSCPGVMVLMSFEVQVNSPWPTSKGLQPTLKVPYHHRLSHPLWNHLLQDKNPKQQRGHGHGSRLPPSNDGYLDKLENMAVVLWKGPRKYPNNRNLVSSAQPPYSSLTTGWLKHTGSPGIVAISATSNSCSSILAPSSYQKQTNNNLKALCLKQLKHPPQTTSRNPWLPFLALEDHLEGQVSPYLEMNMLLQVWHSSTTLTEVALQPWILAKADLLLAISTA